MASKFEHIWLKAEPEAVRLKNEGHTPQYICRAIEKKFFKEKSKYNTVKVWHMRTFPEEWLAEDKRSSDKENRRQQPWSTPQPQTRAPHQLPCAATFSPPNGQKKRKVSPQREAGDYNRFVHDQGYLERPKEIDNEYFLHCFGPQTPSEAPDLLYQQDGSQHQLTSYVSTPTGLSNQQDFIQYQQNNTHQIPSTGNDLSYPAKVKFLPQSSCSLDHASQQSELVCGEEFVGDNWPTEPFSDLIDWNDLSTIDHQDEEPLLTADHQQRHIQETVSEAQHNPLSTHQCLNSLQHASHKNVPQAATNSLANTSRSNQTYSTPNAKQQKYPFEEQNGTLKSSSKSNLAPQNQPPSVSESESRVVHDGYRLTPTFFWYNGHRLMQTYWRYNGTERIPVNPNEFHTHHRGKQAKDQLGRGQEQHGRSNFVAQEILPRAMQSPTTRNATAHHSVLSRSNLNDSGYFSLKSALDSAPSNSTCDSEHNPAPRDPSIDSVLLDSSLGSAVGDKLQLSFRHLNLTGDVVETKEAGNGFVDVLLKCRMRRSMLRS